MMNQPIRVKRETNMEGMPGSFSATRAAILLVLIAVALRMAGIFMYQPVTWPDSGTYSTMASYIHDFDFSSYKGWRTPAYPLVLLLAGQNPFFVWLVQCAMGVVISLLLFWICFVYTGNAAWSLLGGLAHTLALNQLFFEANILSETLSAFLVVSSVASLVYALKDGRPQYGVATGLVSGLTALARPVYIYLGPVFVILMLLFQRDSKRLAAAFAVAFLLPLLGWAAFNKVTIDYFGLSTMAGYNLSNHSGRFIEKATDEYATIRDIFVKHRDRKIAETGSAQMAIFWARDELLEKTGLDDVALSRQFTKLSLELFARHPVLYLRGVAESWASFWAAPMYMRADQFTVRGAAKVVQAIWPVERMFILIMNFLAIAASGWVLFRAALQRLRGVTGVPIPLIVACVIMGASVLQALVEFGENARYGIPTQSLALTLVLLTAWDLRGALRQRGRPAVQRQVAALEG